MKIFKSTALLACISFSVFTTGCASLQQSDGEKPAVSKSSYVKYDGEHLFSGQRQQGTLKVKIQKMVEPDTGVEITLAGMVHYADPSFYDEIQQLIDESYIVLAEGVTKHEDDDFNTMEYQLRYYLELADRLTAVMELSSQKNRIMPNGNVRSADISFEELSELTDTDSKVMAHVMFPFTAVGGELMAISTGYYRSLCLLEERSHDIYIQELRHKLCQLLEEDSESNPHADVVMPKDSIIYARNDRLIEHIDQAIEEGNDVILVPWGAAHMPDLEEKLMQKGFVKKSRRWVDAIEVADYKKIKKDLPTVVTLPYVYNLKKSEDSYETSMILSAFDYKHIRDYYSFDLLWGLFFTNQEKGENIYWRLLPKIGGKPLFLDYTSKDGKERTRMFYFLEF